MTQRSIDAPSLEDVLLDFATQNDPMPARLDRFVKQFPSYEPEIRALASAVAQLEQAPMPAELDGAEAAMAVAYGDRLSASFGQLQAAAPAGPDVLAAISAPELRKLAKQVDLP